MTRSFPTRSELLAFDRLGGCLVIRADTDLRRLDKFLMQLSQTCHWSLSLLNLEKRKDFTGAPFCGDCDSVTLYREIWF